MSKLRKLVKSNTTNVLSRGLLVCLLLLRGVAMRGFTASDNKSNHAHFRRRLILGPQCSFKK